MGTLKTRFALILLDHAHVLFSTEAACDAKLFTADNHCISAHQIVLSAFSEFFRNHFAAFQNVDDGMEMHFNGKL
jgi:hypothetical protein